MNKLIIKLEGLNCNNCAEKIQKATSQLPNITSAQMNIMLQEMQVFYDSTDKDTILAEVSRITKKLEPDVTVYEKGAQPTTSTPPRFTKEMKWRLARYALGLFLYIFAILAPIAPAYALACYVLAYICFGITVLRSASQNILNGKVFDENFLMSIASLGAFAIGEYPEAVAVMLFYQIGEFLQDLAVDKSRHSIKSLMNLKPDFAHILVNGQLSTVAPDEVTRDDIIQIKPGEKVPLDGIIIEGKSQLDASSLIGESVPRVVGAGDEVLSGSINLIGLLTVQVTKPYSESTVSKILEMVENASARKAPTEKFITKFSRYYTPVVVISALLLAFVPPLFTPSPDLAEWVSRALVFLVASCPCAFVVAIPLGFFSGLGAASKDGILVKGGNYLQLLAEIDTVVLDKTGTITKGVFQVSEIQPVGMTQGELLAIAYEVEKSSNHPIAKSIVEAYKKNPSATATEVTNMQEQSGLGLSAEQNGQTVLAGNAKLLETNGITVASYNGLGTVVHFAIGAKYIGHIAISDEIKPDSQSAIAALKAIGVEKIIMLTGDRQESADKVAASVGVDDVHAELLPNHKVEKLEELYTQKPSRKIIFVGDGINDAPVLARADVGFAMGGVGSDAAIEAADVVIMTDQLSKIPRAIQIARRTMTIVKQNAFFAIAVKLVVLLLGAFGLATMWMAVFADVGVTLIAVLNSMRKK